MRGHPDGLEAVEEVGYSDADYVADKDDRKSITGGLVTVDGSLVSWICKRQSGVSLSTMEAEYTAASVVTGSSRRTRVVEGVGGGARRANALARLQPGGAEAARRRRCLCEGEARRRENQVRDPSHERRSAGAGVSRHGAYSSGCADEGGCRAENE